MPFSSKYLTTHLRVVYPAIWTDPTFKAGIHSGDVIAGEVGIIKRDITYSGDVLNTTARIQSKCREFETDIIVSTIC